MTKSQMIQAIRGYDEVMDLVAEIRKAAAGTDDQILNLIERITQASRNATVEDVLIDLKDDGQDDAYDLIKSNY